MNVRKSNIELLRIVAMLMIILLHANYFSIGSPSKENIISSPVASFWRILAEQICVVGVNVFVLISGWFGIKPSLKGLCSLVFQVVFWGTLLLLGGWACGIHIPIKGAINVSCFGAYYWFFVAYVGLYIMSPILNTFIERATKIQFITIVISFFLTEFIYSWIFESGSYNNGCSIISFIGLYLLARYVRLYSSTIKSFRPITDILLYGLLTLIPAIVSYFCIRNEWFQFNPLYYSSPFVIAASLFLLLLFSQKEYQSKAINWVASSTFSVYLIHLHPVVKPYFISTMNHLSNRLDTMAYSIVVIIFAIILLLICAVFDKLRIGSWKCVCNSFLDRWINSFENKCKWRVEEG